MKIITAGHKYELENFENKSQPGQVIQFIEKICNTGSSDSGIANRQFVTLNDGTTNEELIRVLMDRISNLSTKFPCCENTDALMHLAAALTLMEARTADRKSRGVEGKPTL